jgi:hypothetical protein
MKKTSPKRLLLSTETVRSLQPIDDQQLKAAAGGVRPCPYSIVKPPGDSTP